jgi:hypothetical protein
MKLAVALIAGLALTGCHIHYVDPVQPTESLITVTVTPDPLRLLVTCPTGNPNCFGSLDATVSIVESGGVGGRVEYVDVVVYDVVLARNQSEIRLPPEYLRANAGTDRIEANGRMALRPVIQGYPFPAGHQPQLEFVITVRFTDDKGHTTDTTKRVPLL